MNKNTLTMASAVLVLSLSACNNSPRTRYMDLSTGNGIELKKDEKTGRMVSTETGDPVTIYVDRESRDTVWGATGKVINGRVTKSGDGKWIYADADKDTDAGTKGSASGEKDAYKIKDGDYKKEVEKDGDITIKDGDKKIKIDGKTGERKVKKD